MTVYKALFRMDTLRWASSMRIHFRCFYFIALLVTILSGCAAKSSTPFYAPGGGGWNTCKGVHPVLAHLQGCQTNDWMHDPAPITRKNANDKVGNQCLLELAANYGNLNVFRQLLRNGADVRLCATGYAQRFREVWVTNHCDYPKGSTEEFFLLLESSGVEISDKQGLLKTAAIAGCPVAVRFLAARNVDMNWAYEEGLRPLHYVVNMASEEKIETARILVNLGANPYLRSQNGESAIDRGRRILSGRASNWPRMEAVLSTYTGNAQPGVPADRPQAGAR